MNILIIEDEVFLANNLKKALVKEGYEVTVANTGQEGIYYAKERKPAVVILDMKLPDISGIEILKKFEEIELQTNTIMITAHGNVDTAILAIKNGAYDFIEKPFNVEKLKVAIRNATKTLRLTKNIHSKISSEKKEFGLHSLVGESKPIEELKEMLEILINSDPKTILITGESGTGKGLVAKILHYNGERATGPFIELNCAAIPENLLESELFGHEEGSFTDAKKTTTGIFEDADGGSLFLDEIGDMNINLQAKLIKVVEERRFRKIGGKKDIDVDVRIIAATNQDLQNLVEQNKFREDLFHRLNVISIKMPTLRERKNDIPLIAENFVNYFNNDMNKNIKSISEDIMNDFIYYDWPGNVRELRSTIEKATILSDGEKLNEKYINIEPNSEENIEIEKTSDKVVMHISIDGSTTLDTIEENIIRQALELNNMNQTKTAKMLGVNRQNLRYKMKKMGLLN